MNLERQDWIDQYIKKEMPEDERQAFEEAMEADETLRRQYEATRLVTDAIHDVAADQEMYEILRQTPEKEMRTLMDKINLRSKERREAKGARPLFREFAFCHGGDYNAKLFDIKEPAPVVQPPSTPSTIEKQTSMEEERASGGKRFLRHAAWVAAAILAAAIITRIVLSPSPGSMEGLYVAYYETARYEELSPRGASSQTDETAKEAFTEYRKGNYLAALRLFETTPQEPDILFYSAICQMELNAPEKAIPLLSSLVEKGDRNPYYQSAEWYLSMAYLKTNQKEKVTPLLQRIANENGFYAEKAEELLKKLK